MRTSYSNAVRVALIHGPRTFMISRCLVSMHSAVAATAAADGTLAAVAVTQAAALLSGQFNLDLAAAATSAATSAAVPAASSWAFIYISFQVPSLPLFAIVRT